jgi:hypothetical protein
MELPLELRLQVYAELLGGKTTDDPRARRYPQILAVSKAIHQEAEHELYHRSTMAIQITATALKTHDFCTSSTFSIGNSIILDATNCFDTSTWSLTQRLPMALSKIRNISLTITLRADIEHNQLLRFPFASRQFNQVHHILNAIVAVSYGTLRSLNIEFEIFDGPGHDYTIPMDVAAMNGVLWPLKKMAPSVCLSVQGLPAHAKSLTLTTRDESTMAEHPFTLYRNVHANADTVVKLLKHDTVVGKRLASMLRSVEESVHSKRWRCGDEGLVNDLRFLEAWIVEYRVRALVVEMGRDVKEA